MFSSTTINNIYEKYRENKLSHAYLIETNNLKKASEDIKELIKAINCSKEYDKNCTKCNLCNLINKNNLPSLVVIEPDGATIKKNQIEDLKKTFETIPLYSKYNTYIIKEAEKLNDSSANAMLKFVEEPTEGIIGFFLTSNKDVMIETIKSRCQIYVLNYEEKEIYDRLKITEEDYQIYKDFIKTYLDEIKSNHFINHKDFLLSVFPDRNQVMNLFQIILELFYQNYLKQINMSYDSSIANIYEVTDNCNNIQKKMKIISNILQEMSYNVNIELILDKFVIEMRGIYE